jgi:hypothetical protein
MQTQIAVADIGPPGYPQTATRGDEDGKPAPGFANPRAGVRA